MVDQEKLRPGFHQTPHGGYLHGLGMSRMSTVEFDGRRTDRVDVDTLLIRPDGCVAWALPTGQDLDATTLVRALGTCAVLTVVSDSLSKKVGIR